LIFIQREVILLWKYKHCPRSSSRSSSADLDLMQRYLHGSDLQADRAEQILSRAEVAGLDLQADGADPAL
jgi:hypothetical protein